MLSINPCDFAWLERILRVSALTSVLDLRSVNSANAALSPQESRDAVHLQCHLDCQAGSENKVRRTLIELASASQGAGKYLLSALPDQAQSRVFRIFEVYKNKDAFKARKASELFKRLAERKIMPELESPIQEARIPPDIPRLGEIQVRSVTSLQDGAASALTSSTSATNAK